MKIDVKHWRSGAIGNFLILWFLISRALLAQPTYTQITDTVYTPVSGLTFTGQLQISNPVMVGTNATTIGQWLTSIPIVNGALSVALVPNDTAQPAGSVYVFKFQPQIGRGAAWTQYCSVPTSGAPVLLGSICTTSAPLAPGPTSPISLQFLTVTIPNAQVLTLHSVGFVLVQAAGPGTFLQVLSATFENIFLTAAYTGGGAISINYTGPGGQAASSQVISTFLTAPIVNEMVVLNPATATGVQVTSPTFLNAPLVLTSSIQDFAGGSGSLIVHLTYLRHTGF